MNILVVGATGTLGRQVVRRALESGHQVISLVRNPAKTAFLSEWGSQVRVGDLLQPRSLDRALEGVEVVIDSATVRLTDSLSAKQVDWDGKVNLINACRAAQIQQYIFFSIMGAQHEYSHVPLMHFKHHAELYLQRSQMPYTIFRLPGFMQGLIGQYALPILEEHGVWITSRSVPTAYIDTQDVARFVVKAIGCEAAIGKTLPLVGPRAWQPREIIELCEKLSNREAKVLTTSVEFLRVVRRIAQFFQWSWNIADRLAFVEVLAADEPMDADMTETYEILGIDPDSLTRLEDYLGEYFQKMLKRIQEQNIKRPKVRTPF